MTKIMTGLGGFYSTEASQLVESCSSFGS